MTLTASGAASYTWNPGALTGTNVAVKVTLIPAQIMVEDAEAFIVGLGLTTNVIVCVAEHVPLSPSTVYVVVAVGDTTAVVPLKTPGFHV